MDVSSLHFFVRNITNCTKYVRKTIKKPISSGNRQIGSQELFLMLSAVVAHVVGET